MQNYDHIKKENIGLIEVMGLAVLPSRLKQEMALLKDAILTGSELEKDEMLQKHAEWVAEFLPVLSGLGLIVPMFCIEGIKQLFDWEYPMFTLFCRWRRLLLWGCAVLYICAVSHQVPRSLSPVLFGPRPGACGGYRCRSGTLRDDQGHDVDGHLGGVLNLWQRCGNLP